MKRLTDKFTVDASGTMHLSEQNTTGSDSSRQADALLSHRLSALLTRRFALVAARTDGRRERRLQADGVNKVHQFDSQVVDEFRVSFDLVDGNFD